MGAAYHDGKVYFLGGATQTRFSDAVDIYVPQRGGGSWLTETPAKVQRLSQPRANIMVGVVDFMPNELYNPDIPYAVPGDQKPWNQMLVAAGGLVGGGTDRWFFEGRSMASPRMDFIKDGEVLTADFMHDYLSRGVQDASLATLDGKIYVAGGLTNLHLPSKRFEVFTWKKPYICASIARDNDMCAHKDMTRIQPGPFSPITPSCDYQFIPKFTPWFCPCPNINSIPQDGAYTINYDNECEGDIRPDPIDRTRCRTSPQCFTKCKLDSDALAASQHFGDPQAVGDCPGLLERPFDDAAEAFMLKTDITVPYFGVTKLDDAGKRVTFGQVQTRFRDIAICPNECFPCGSRRPSGKQGICVKPNRFDQTDKTDDLYQGGIVPPS